MRFAQIRDATLQVDVRLFADRPTVVFVNSLGSDLRIWDGVVEALARARIGAARYDLRGHGLSDLATPPSRMEAHIDDLAALMDHLAIQRATICGISVGGMIALGLSHRRPEKVAALILCCTGAVIGTAETWNARIAAVEQGGVASIAETVLQRWFSPAAYGEGGGLLAIARNMLARTPAAGYAATCVALRDADLTQAAQAVRAVLGQDHAGRRQLGHLVAPEAMRGDALLRAELLPAPVAGVWIVIDDLIELVLRRELSTRATMTRLSARLAQHLLGLGPSLHPALLACCRWILRWRL